jgi:hypothetical protein
MRIHLYYTDKTPAEMLSTDLAGLTTFEKEHSGQKRVKRIIDFQFCSHSDYDVQILCEPVEPWAKEMPAPPVEEAKPTTRVDFGEVEVSPI